MKGNNELILNEATMIEIVQQWVESTVKGPPPVVKAVKYELEGMSGSFVVRLFGPAETEADR